MLREILTARTRPSDKALYNIWARKLTGGWAETTITGTLPLAFLSKTAQTLTDYRIYGTAAGTGVRTAQLFNKNATDTANGYVGGARLVSDGSTAASSRSSISEYIAIQSDDDYYLNISELLPSSLSSVCFYDSDKIYISGERYGSVTELTFHSPVGASYCRITYLTSAASETMLATDVSEYIPYGYQIPLSLTDGTNSTDYVLYIGDTKLGEDEYVDYSEQKIYKDVSGALTPTEPPLPFPAIAAYQGENTVSSTETVGSVSVTGKIKEVTP